MPCFCSLGLCSYLKLPSSFLAKAPSWKPRVLYLGLGNYFRKVNESTEEVKPQCGALVSVATSQVPRAVGA